MNYSIKLYYLPVLLFLAACQSQPPDVAKDSFFIQNPQELSERTVSTLALGAPAPDFRLPGTDGKYHSLGDFKDAKVLVVLFTCNHCPTAQAYEDRVIKIVKDYKERGVQLVAISPNSPLGLLYEELGYSDLNDDFEEMIIRSKDKDFNFPYLYDGDDENASLEYGPVATPHAFVFDKDRQLQYKGRLDRIEKPGEANAEDLREAIDAVLKGETPALQETKTFGCSTKWAWKTKMKKEVDQTWSEKEVTLDQIDLNSVTELVKNDDSQKLRLINVWATWCGPCVLEYPGFIEIQRMFGARDFEFVSISTDKLTKENKVLEFLRDKQSAVKNYITIEDDKYDLIEAIDPDWNGALPYTILIEPGGKVVWRHQGSVDFYSLKKIIVEHSMIGRYY